MASCTRGRSPFNRTVHGFVIPIVLMLVGLWLPPVVIVAAVARAAHVAWDRGLGYGAADA